MADYDLSKFVPDPAVGSGFVPDGKFIPDPPPRSAVGEIGSQALGGLYEGLAGAGGALQAPAEIAGQQPGVVSRVGKALADYASERANAPENQPQTETHGPVTNAIAKGARALTAFVPALAAQAVTASPGALAGGLAGGALAGPPGAAVGAAAGEMIGGGAGIGGYTALQQWHESYQKALSELPDAPDRDARARDYAAQSAGLQGGLMGGVGALTGGAGKVAQVLGKAAGIGEQTAAGVGADVAGKRFLPEFAKQAAVGTAANVGLGAAGAAGQSVIDTGAGMQAPSPGEAALESIPSSAISSIGFLPLMAHGAFGTVKQAMKLRDTLVQTKAAPDDRAAAGSQMYQAMAQVDPDGAGERAKNAAAAINQGKPIGLTPDWTEGPHPSLEQAALPAPQPIIPPAIAPTVESQAAQDRADAVYAARDAEEARQAGLPPPPEPPEPPPLALSSVQRMDDQSGTVPNEEQRQAAQELVDKNDALWAQRDAQERQVKTAMQLAMERAQAEREAKAQQIEAAGDGGPLSTVAATAVRSGAEDIAKGREAEQAGAEQQAAAQKEAEDAQAEQQKAFEQAQAERSKQVQQTVDEASKAADARHADEAQAAEAAVDLVRNPKPVAEGEKPEPPPTKAEIEQHSASIDRSIATTQDHADVLRATGDEAGATALERQVEDLRKGQQELAATAPGKPSPSAASTAESSSRTPAADASSSRPQEAPIVSRGDASQTIPHAVLGIPHAVSDIPRAATTTLDYGIAPAAIPETAPSRRDEVLARMRAGTGKSTTPDGVTTDVAAAHPTDVAAHQAASSPLNDRTPPTTAQAEAGNYAKGHIQVGPLDISIENPEGSPRHNIDTAKIDTLATKNAGTPIGDQYQTVSDQLKAGEAGKALATLRSINDMPARAMRPTTWARKIADAHYGYIKGTVGADKDHIDAFVKPGTPADHDGPVFVIDQRNKAGGFDEHKAMIGYAAEGEARAAYSANYPPDFKVGTVKQTTMEQFNSWARSDQTARPFAMRKRIAGEPSEAQVAARARFAEAARARNAAVAPGDAAAVLPGLARMQAAKAAREAAAAKPASAVVAQPSGFPVGGYHAVEAATGRNLGQVAYGEIPRRFPTPEKATAFGERVLAKEAKDAPKLATGLSFKGPLSVDDVNKVVSGITRELGNAPRINVRASVQEFPFAQSERIKNAITVGGTVRGAFYKGEVWLAASALHDAAAVHEVLLHELGHYGLAGVLRGTLKPTMDRIYVSNDRVRALADAKMAELGYDRALATEEALADLAGKGQWQDVKGLPLLFMMIRGALRKLGIAVKFSDNDIAGLLAQSRRFVEKGEGGSRLSDARLSVDKSGEIDRDGLTSQMAAIVKGGAAADEPKLSATAAIAPAAGTAPADDRKGPGGAPLYSGVERKELPKSPVFASLQKIFAPASRGPIATLQAGIMRENFAKQARDSEVANNDMRQYAKAFSKMSVADSIKFVDAYERGGVAGVDPSLRDVAASMKAFNDDLSKQVQDLDTGKLQDLNENYLGRIWMDPADKVSSVFARRPLEGSKGFLKQRMYQYFSQGIKAGLVPITYNPVEMMLLKGQEIRRYIYAQKIFAEMKQEGLVAKWKYGEQPAGWTALNDKIAQAGAERYYAPDEAATLINNHLSPGLQGNGAYDAFRKAGMMLNSAQLGLSLFHLGFTTVDSMVSKAALGVQQLSRGQFLQGIGNIASSINPATPFLNAYKGDKLLRAYLGDLKEPSMAPIVEALVHGGGRTRLDEFYRNATLNGFKQAIVRNDKLGAAKAFLPTVMDHINAPIFEQLVPRQKLGVFFDLAKDWIARNPDASLSEKREAMGKFWDSVDNRMGQLAYDNVFWNRTLKDSLMVGVRSVGWNLGTFRELGGGLLDLKNIRANRELSSRTGYVIALPFVTAVMGSMIGYMYTGQGPDELKDYFFPKTGRLRPDGTEDRVSLPSYMKDVYAYGHDIAGLGKYGSDPTKTLQNKLHPLLGIIAQMVSNKDFFGGAIRSPGDPVVQQLTDEANYLIDQMTPFGLRNYQQQAKVKGEEPTVAGYLTSPSMIGVTPAAAHITQNDQQQEASALGAAKDSLMTKFREALQAGADPREVSKRMLAAGLRMPEVTMVLREGLSPVRSSKLPPRRLIPQVAQN